MLLWFFRSTCCIGLETTIFSFRYGKYTGTKIFLNLPKMLPLYLSTLYNLNGKIYSYLKIRDKIILFEFFHPYKGPPYLIMRCRMISLLAYPSHSQSSTLYFVHPSITGTPFGSGRCSDSSAMTPAALCAGGVMPTRLT